MGRSSLFTRSKMIRYVKVMEKFAFFSIVFGTVGYIYMTKDQEKIEKDNFLSQYTNKYANQIPEVTATTTTSTETNTNTTTTNPSSK